MTTNVRTGATMDNRELHKAETELESSVNDNQNE